MSRRDVIAGGAAAVSLAASGAGAASPVTVHVAEHVLDSHDALGLAELVRRREVSAAELLEAAIARADRLNPRFNFMAQRLDERARAVVARGAPEGPFTGVPWLLKDLNTHIAGELSEGGSRFYRGNRASVTSELVMRHELAGFVIFGKTTTPEFGLTGTTENKLNGDTRNPWNPAHIAGGSSGGAAAAVAAGVLPAAHATDGGGSIRLPASCCGLFGLKPSRGRIPMGPLRTEGWGGLSSHHAITRTVRDSAAIMDATHGVEPGSRYGAPAPADGFLAQTQRDPRPLRIALMLSPASGGPVDPQCVAAAQAAARLSESLGHHVEEAAPVLNAAALGQASFAIMAPSILADISDRAAALGITAGPDVLEPMTLAFAEYGRHFSAMDMARANNLFQSASVTVAQFMERFDLILAPTLAAPPLELGQINLSPDCDFAEWGRRAGMFTPFTQMANWSGQPSMSVPLAMSNNGLPIGVMFTGRFGDEATLFALAAQLERAAPWADRRPTFAQ